MKKKNLPPLLLASRDSLLALAQTIEAAIRLEKVGFTPKIAALKTAGDLKLDSPLYRVADQGTKEGRAFFTRELDDALITGRADAAVHSFKDLPAEKIDGISNPILFSETSTADILLSTDPLSLAEGGKNYTIGTSSLRRIHQLGFAWPYAKTVTLRGNIVTRLRKLIEKHDSINAILIAEAGFKRMKEFMGIPVEKYAHFLDEATLEHLTIELEHFKTYLSQKLYTHALPESKFPTAPGQGVLAFQFSEKERHKFTEHLDEIFPEHPRTAARALLERSVMTGLETGCHAPLGVSAHYTNGDTFHVSLCFSKSTTTSPVGFANSVFIERTTLSADALVDEVRRPFETIYWWGLNDVT
ncbi:MAG TPA: hypothetical protein PLY93_07525, partial [Turneriella sp.]|nr:hypothetical protein [Turneriella sp.]